MTRPRSCRCQRTRLAARSSRGADGTSADATAAGAGGAAPAQLGDGQAAEADPEGAAPPRAAARRPPQRLHTGADPRAQLRWIGAELADERHRLLAVLRLPPLAIHVPGQGD